jgi:biotin carboxyl carrier protein/serine/threonine protein kinase
MTEDGVPKLTDFGLAKDDTADTGMTIEGAVIGTLDFMPLEQRQGAEFTDHRSDLWSLAATFYQMLTGKSPKVINISGIPPKLQSVVTTALEDSKEDRFQSVIEMREAILDAHSGKMDTSRSLGEGECPQCATLSPPDQKFCRNCSAQLQVNCLGCQAEIAIWDNGCGACGAQQAPLVDKGLADLKDAHDQAESLLVELDFKAAVKKAAVIENETDSRLQQFTTWHEDFSARLASSKSLEHTRLRELLQEALAHELAYDYKSGLQTLRPVVASLKQTIVSGSEDTADTLTTRLTAKRARIKELELLIRERVTKNELGGLLTLVNELLILKPERSDAQKLHAQLEKREAQIDVRNQHIIAQVRQHMRQLQFDEAVQVLGTIAPEYQTSTTVALIQKAAAEKAASADVCRAEAEFHNLDFINLDEVNIPYDILELVPEEIARENATLPLSLEGDALKVLLSDPRDLETIEKLRFILNREILIAIAPRENILEAINRYYGAARFSAKELRKTNPLTTPKNPLEHIVTIRSTMVGTFYDRPYPESEPYVRVGDMVTEESTVCIIKATQVFNKLTAEIHGKVVAVLVHDKAPVYVGKPLFKVDINA